MAKVRTNIILNLYEHSMVMDQIRIGLVLMLIEILKNTLSYEPDIEKIKSLQGSITELRRIKTLREEVIEGLKN